jgi:hypothetical protein
MKTLKLKLNLALNGKKSGDVVEVPCDEHGIPLEKFWRDRLKDSEIDNCVEKIDSKPKKKSDSKGDS